MFGKRFSSVNKTNEQLKEQVTALKETESALVLVQDRVKKVDSVENEKNAKEEIDVLTEVRSLLTENVVVYQTHLKPDIAEITVQSASLGDMTRFLVIATNLHQFRSVNLVDFRFKPDTGYLTTLGFIK